MVKELVILGFLKSMGAHGYKLSEMLEKSIGLGITIKKGNAYRLLSEMQKKGWVKSHEERAGNRPPKKIYSLTQKGEGEFDFLLRESLQSYISAEIPNAATLNYLSHLPATDAVMFLKKKLEVLQDRLKIFSEYDKEFLDIHSGINMVFQYHQFELRFLKDLIHQMETTDSNIDQ